jgi:nicotinamidase-related amidase
MAHSDVNLARAVLILLDIQEDYLEAKGPLAQLGFEPVGDEARRTFLGNCQSLIRKARESGRPVVHVRTAFRPDLTDCFFPPKWRETFGVPPLLVEGSSGAGIAPELAPEDGDFVITKKGLCAFQFTHLDRLLNSLGVDTCILAGSCGVAGSIDETCRTAGLVGYDTVVVSDAVYPLRTPHVETLTNQSAIKTTEEVIGLMKAIASRGTTEPKITPALILVALNNDGNHPLGSKYRYRITAHGPGISEEKLALYIRNNNRLIEAMTAKGFPVVHSQTAVRLDKADDAHSFQSDRNRGPERRRNFPPGVGYMIEGTWGAEILEGVKLPEGYYRVYKKGNSSFGLTHLDRLFRNLGVNFCIITGDSTTGCVSNTVRDSVALGYKTIVVSDATNRANIPYHEILANRADVRSTDEVLTFLEKLAPAEIKRAEAGEEYARVAG